MDFDLVGDTEANVGLAYREDPSQAWSVYEWYTLQAGADVPFACKGGVCCTCRAKLVEGDVDMKVNYALEQEEVDQGFILACQSIPKSEKVIVDFDQ